MVNGRTWLVMAVMVAVLSACSSQSPAGSTLASIRRPSPTGDSGLSPAAGDARFIECAKAHGATIPAGFNPRHKPELYQLSDAVNQACDQILQDSQPPMTAAERQAWLDYVKCLRGSGVSVSDPVFGRGEVTLTFGTGTDTNSRTFQSARQTCRQRSGLPATTGPG
jgi:hypothetical protein